MKKFRLIAALLPLMLLTSCGGNKLEQAFYDTAVALNSTTKVIIALHDQKAIDDSTFTDLLKGIRPVAQIHKQAVVFVKSVGTIDGTNSAVVLGYIDQAIAALDALQAQGALGIRNLDSRNAFNGGIQTTRIATTTLRAIIAGIKKPTPVNLGKVATI